MHKLRANLWVQALVVSLIACFLSVAHGAERESQAFKMNNGLEVLLTHDADVHRSAAALSVGVGYYYDPEEKSGLAHYLEHMLFLGTKKFL